ncbi:MAG: emopamil-binding family protein [Polyangiales bacterium]
MGRSSDGTPLSMRPGDWFFVAAFAFFAFSSFFSDSWHALGLLEGDAFWSRANRWYAEVSADHFFAAEHQYVRVNTGISGLIYGPFYLVLVYAFVTGKNWIRTPALIYVGAMLHGLTEYCVWEYWIGPPPGKPLIFWAFTAPYGIVPLLLAVRMWKPRPFGPKEA